MPRKSTTASCDAESTERFQRDVIPLNNQLFAPAMRLTRNAQDAEDLVQEAMLRAYAGFGTFREGTNVKAWLFRILYNTWISQYRTKRRRPAEVSVECVSDLNAVALRTSTRPHLVEETALELMTDGEVAAAMMALQPTIRTAIYYADVLGFTCREIAAITGSPPGTVMSRIHRGRKRLRTTLFAMATRHGLVSEQDSFQAA